MSIRRFWHPIVQHIFKSGQIKKSSSKCSYQTRLKTFIEVCQSLLPIACHEDFSHCQVSICRCHYLRHHCVKGVSDDPSNLSRNSTNAHSYKHVSIRLFLFRLMTHIKLSFQELICPEESWPSNHTPAHASQVTFVNWSDTLFSNQPCKVAAIPDLLSIDLSSGLHQQDWCVDRAYASGMFGNYKASKE